MTSPGNVDLVRVLEPFFGGDTQARNMAGIVCQFSGYMCGDKGYMQFRAGIMTLVFRAQAIGSEGVQIYLTELPRPILIDNEAYMNWITTDLTYLGYDVNPLFLHSLHNNILFGRGPFLRVNFESRTWEMFPLPKPEDQDCFGEYDSEEDDYVN